MNETIHQVPALIRKLYDLVAELERLFPGRKFTLDGHLVGSIGEVIAAAAYGLSLLPASTENHDAVAVDGRKVQIKATQGRSLGLRAEPEHLLVLHLAKDGSFAEIFNGPGSTAWMKAGKMQKNGTRPISVAQLRKLQSQVNPKQVLPRLPI